MNDLIPLLVTKHGQLGYKSVSQCNSSQNIVSKLVKARKRKREGKKINVCHEQLGKMECDGKLLLSLSAWSYAGP